LRFSHSRPAILTAVGILRLRKGPRAGSAGAAHLAKGAVAQEEQEVKLALVVPGPFGPAHYPAAAPLMAFSCAVLLPKTTLEVTKRLLLEADRLVRHSLQECGAPAPVVWELCSWLEAELPSILELVMPMHVGGVFEEDKALEPEPEPEKRQQLTKYERTRARMEAEEGVQRRLKTEQTEKMLDSAALAAGRAPSNGDGPRFTYEIRWLADGSTMNDGSTMTIRPDEVGSRLTIEGSLADRTAVAGHALTVRTLLERLSALSVFIVYQFCMVLLYGHAGRLTTQNGDFRPGQYAVGQPVRACFSGAWSKAEVVGRIEHAAPAGTPNQQAAAAAKEAKAAREAAAEEARSIASLAEEAEREVEEVETAEARQREHMMAMAKAAATRRELSNRGAARSLEPNAAASAR
jgi:hypothetical protein